MDLTEENMKALGEYLQKTLNPDPNVRWPAEKFLRSVEGTQNYPILLLQLVNRSDVDLTIRVAGSVTFKNFIKKNWPIDDDGNNRVFDVDRQKIKEVIVESMLVSPPLVQKQLSDAVSIIGKHDFPEKWPTLLTGMVEKFATGDFNVINGVLHTAHSIFKRYRHEFKSNALWTEIKFVLDTFAKPLTDLFIATYGLTEVHGNNPEALKVIYSSLVLISKIFLSLNSQDLPEFFEDNMGTWMTLFQKLLKTDVKLLETDSDEEAGLVEEVRSQVCSNLQLYAEMYDEEFRPYLGAFVTDIWELLVRTDLRPKYDLLVSQALKFLSTVASRSYYRELFEDPNTLGKICNNVIIHNIQLRDSDVELFEDNPEEYLKRDIEGSDVETRRRSACDLVRALTKQFDRQVTDIFSHFVQGMLSEYRRDADNRWRQKNSAVYLVVALADQGGTEKHGVTKASALVDVADFARQHIIPDLTAPDKSGVGQQVIRADALKYMLKFRSVLPGDLVIGALPAAARHLSSSSPVVHSSAAAFIASILVLRTPDGKSLVSGDTLAPLAGDLIRNLMNVLSMKGSEENEYAMKAVLRCVATLGERSLPFLGELLVRLSERLAIAAKNPSRPVFNHYLFETLAASIRIVCKKTPEAVTSFEELLFPIFQVILQEDVQDFLPYVFQVLSLLVGQRQGQLADPYLALYPCLVAPTLWERHGNIRPLCALLRAIVAAAAPSHYAPSGPINLNTLLGLYQKLIMSRANDHEGFALMQAMLRTTPRELMSPFLKQILVLLFQRVTASKTVKFVKGLVVFFCSFVIIYGAQTFIDLVDQIQPQMFSMVCDRLLVPEANKVDGLRERKVVAVGLVQLATGTPQLTDGAYASHWPGLVKTCLGVLECVPVTGVEDDEPQLPDDENTSSFQPTDSACAQLAFAALPPIDPAPEIKDPRHYLATELSKLSSSAPGKLSAVISQNLSPAEQTVLQNYLSTAGVPLS